MVIKTKELQKGQFGIDWKQKRYKRAKRARQGAETRRQKGKNQKVEGRSE